MKIILALIGLFFLVNGCASLPPALTYLGYIKFGADGISYFTTNKSTSDHIVSSALEQDCAFHRVLFQEEICKNYAPDMNLTLSKEQQSKKDASVTVMQN